MSPRCWVLAALTLPAAAMAQLPLPEPRIPDSPPYPPAMITAEGHVSPLDPGVVHLSFSPEGGLKADRKGVWLLNYPIHDIQRPADVDDERLSEAVLGGRRADVKNWMVFIPGAEDVSTPPLEAPAFEPAAGIGIWVDAASAEAADSNVGSRGHPLKSISEGVRRAIPGSVVMVLPAVYPEALRIDKSGTPDKPIVIEGVRSPDGVLPVISGLAPVRGLRATQAWPRVYRAEAGEALGGLYDGGRALVEKNHPSELQPGEFCFNWGSDEFLNLRHDGALDPQSDRAAGPWTELTADATGLFDLGRLAGQGGKGAVLWGSAYVWADHDMQGDIDIGEWFRAGRATGVAWAAQANPFRVWVNGRRIPGAVYSTRAHSRVNDARADLNMGRGDTLHDVTFQPGWNHLVFQWDTTPHPGAAGFRFLFAPFGALRSAASAVKGVPSGAPAKFLTRLSVLGPYPAQRENAIYVRAFDDGNPGRPAAGEMTMAGHYGPLVDLSGSHLWLRGLELVGASLSQQKGVITLSGEGDRVEANIIRHAEVRGVSIEPQDGMSQDSAPMVVRDNIISDPGNVGIGVNSAAEAARAALTAQSQNSKAPGRPRIVIEGNTITNANWAAYPVLWESGCIKAFRLTGAVIRGNTCVAPNGPGIWLDWEHFNNRVEGNFISGAYAFAIGIEASPGPNLVANNMVVDTRPGPVWFRAGIMSWDGAGLWAVNNTVESAESSGSWNGIRGTIGVQANGNTALRNTAWDASIAASRGHRVVLNVVQGSPTALGRPSPGDVEEGNVVLTAARARAQSALPGDVPASAAAPAATVGPLPLNDYFGFCRALAPRQAGAFRDAALMPVTMAPVIEIERWDGRCTRVTQ